MIFETTFYSLYQVSHELHFLTPTPKNLPRTPVPPSRPTEVVFSSTLSPSESSDLRINTRGCLDPQIKVMARLFLL